MRKLLVILLLFTMCFVVLAQDREKVDLSVVHRIRTEAFQNSKVMDHLFYLTDVHGPRLTGSPGYGLAGEWVATQLRQWGLTNVTVEKFPWGRGWTLNRLSVHLLEPQYAPLIAVASPWAPGLPGNGRASGEPVMAALASIGTAEVDRFIEQNKGKLKGKIVLASAMRELNAQTSAASRRYSEDELAKEAMAPDPAARPFAFGTPPGGRPPGPPVGRDEMRRAQAKLTEFFGNEGVLAVFYAGRGDGGTVFATGSTTQRDPKLPLGPPVITLAAEHYNRIARLLQRKVPVKVELEMQAQFIDDTPHAFNVLADIPGGGKKDQIVMVGAHLDSWTGGTGATDNAAGSAVMMEVVRILKSLDLKMDRTVRLALWGGEEGGLIGSRFHVKEHYADPETMTLKPLHPKLSAYYNYDNGTGKIRGVYLQNNDMLRPIFEAWLAPFRDLGATTVTIRNTSGTDHLSFDAVGLPGFQFIQDPVEYDSRTHHSNMDVYDRIQASDLRQSAAIIASFVYHTAVRDQVLPRKPLPKPQPARGGRGGERPTE